MLITSNESLTKQTQKAYEELKNPEVKNSFQSIGFENKLLIDVSSNIEKVKPLAIACLDASPTPPRTIGRVSTTFFAASASNGLIEGPYSSPVHFVDHEVSINKEHGKLREKRQTNLEIHGILKYFNNPDTDNFYALDGSVKYLRTSIPSLINSDLDYSSVSPANLDRLCEILDNGSLLAFVKQSESNEVHKLLKSEVLGIECLYEYQILNQLLEPGQYFIDEKKPSNLVHLNFDISIEQATSFNNVSDVLSMYRVITYKPLNNSGCVRVEYHQNQENNILQILKSIDFDKSSKQIVEPFCQYFADQWAKYYARVYEDFWMVENDPYISETSGQALFPEKSRTDSFKKNIGGI